MNKGDREEGSDTEKVTETTPALNNTREVGSGDDDKALETDNMLKSDVKASLTDDHSKVTFKASDSSSPYNGDAKVTIASQPKGFSGMDKKELMKYCDDPFWVILRWVLFITFWLIWLAMLAGAIVIVIYAPKCPPPPERDWWQRSPVYQIYARSFKDSDGDGTGDLKGIESKLDYLKDDLGVESVWITPIYKSPMVDNGYDVEDYTEIDPRFGTMDDFDSLIKAMKKKGIKLIMDFVPNHTSNNHTWFKNSELGEPGYEDYYVWKDSTSSIKPPNNWLSVFGGSAWTYSNIRKQWYLHQFYKEQPDLNVRNEKVVEELKNVLLFWLNKGVAGFRMDAVAHLFEDSEFRNEEKSGKTKDTQSYDYLEHTYTTDQPETFGLLRKFREVLDSYNGTDSSNKVMFTEAYDPIPKIMRYYGNETAPIAHFPFNFELITMPLEELTGTNLNETAISWTNNMPKKIGWANWVLGNHDNSRVATRFGEDLVDAMNMITMLLPGTPVTYYGEEIGMEDTEISDEQKKDAFGRDPERTPMQWNDEIHAGFTTGTPWLPVNPNYTLVNVETQKKSHRSHLGIYSDLVKLRKEKASLFGEVKFLYNSDTIFSFSRIIKGAPGLCVVVNFGNTTETVDLSKAEGMPEDVNLKLPTETKGKQIKLHSSKLKVEAKKGMVFTFVPKFK